MTEDKLIALLSPEKADETEKSKSGRWQLMMIFCNGLILTIAAFVTLVIYTDRIKDSSVQDTTNYFISDINYRISNVIALFEVSSNVNDSFTIMGNNNILDYFHFITKISIQDKTVKNIPRNIDFVNVVNTSDVKAFTQELGKTENQGAPIFFSTENGLLIGRKGKGAHYIASIRIDKLTDILGSVRYDSIQRFKMFDTHNDKKIIDFESDTLGLAIQKNDTPQTIKDVVFLNKTFEMVLQVSNTSLFSLAISYRLLYFF